MITCTCPKCEAVVGKFDCYDDHGAVLVYCPQCEAMLEVHNAQLDFADEGVYDDETGITTGEGGTLVLQYATCEEEDEE